MPPASRAYDHLTLLPRAYALGFTLVACFAANEQLNQLPQRLTSPTFYPMLTAFSHMQNQLRNREIDNQPGGVDECGDKGRGKYSGIDADPLRCDRNQ